MNKEQRRRMIERIRKSPSFILVTWDGKGLPVFQYDVKKCVDELDLRHVVMQKCAELVERTCLMASIELKKSKEMSEIDKKVDEYKEERSKALRSSYCEDCEHEFEERDCEPGSELCVVVPSIGGVSDEA